MPQIYKAQSLRPGMRAQGHFFGRGFRGVIDGVYTIQAQGLVEVHVTLEAAIEVAGKRLASVCLWLNPACLMYTEDGKSEIGAITTIWA